jgi:hypothetical protein
MAMKDGREFTTYVDAARGNPNKKLLTKEEIEEKFWGNVANIPMLVQW